MLTRLAHRQADATSPAVNAIPLGTNGCGTTLTTDQRGALRPNQSACDIGAYEFGDIATQNLVSSRTAVIHNSEFTFTATVSNAGAASASGVTLLETISSGAKFKSAASTLGSCSVSEVVLCNLGEVGPATTVTVVITVKVTGTSGEMLSSQATVSATSGDTIAGNDVKTVGGIAVK